MIGGMPALPLPRRRVCAQLLALGLLPSGALHAASLPPQVRQALRESGLVLMLRHAQTDPGVGDPPGFRLGQCSTQRNLSAAGREQSRRIGEQLRALQLTPHVVRSSAWCRCTETAELAFGKAERWPPLNSFFESRRDEPAQTAELRRMLARPWPGHVEAWVTHMVNIAALTGQGVAMGELLVLARGGPTPQQLLRLAV